MLFILLIFLAIGVYEWPKLKKAPKSARFVFGGLWIVLLLYEEWITRFKLMPLPYLVIHAVLGWADQVFSFAPS